MQSLAPALGSWSVRPGEYFLNAIALLTASASLTWQIAALIRHGTPSTDWLPQALVCIAAVCTAAGSAARTFRRWAEPALVMCRIIPAIQRGNLPVSVLSDVKGGLRPLALAIQDMAIELRRQRGEVRKLEQEIRDRIANRTDALERALGSLKQKAAHDPLTGLFNRRVMEEHLPRLVERRRVDSSNNDLSLLMIDVDHFKQLNDTLGHAAGDELLRTIGQLIQSAIRAGDMAFRCGGDEFVVVLDGCSVENAKGLASRMIRLVDDLTRTLKVPHPPRLSIGISTLATLKDPTTSALLEDADQRLYQVKGARKSALGIKPSDRM